MANGKGKDRGGRDGGKDDGVDSEGDGDGKGSAQAEESQPVVAPLSELEQECAKSRSVLHANIGACHVKLVSLADIAPDNA